MASPDQTESKWFGVFERVRTRYKTDRALRRQVRKGVAAITLIILFVWFLFPFLWALKTSLQARPVAQAYPPVLWGFELQWSNYTRVLFDSAFLQYLWNGIVTSVVSTMFAMLFAVPHAYALSKYRYYLRSVSMYLVVAIRVFPLIGLAVPFYILYSEFGLINTKLGVVIVLTMLYTPFIVWIIKGYFDGLPKSMVEAARIDGCSKFQAFYKIMLPLAKPALASSVIFAWLESFNHFTLVFFLTTSPQAQTIPFGVLTFIRDNFTPWNLMTAAALLGTIPSLLIVIFFQRYLIKGMQA